ncbi:MAG: hypothetical protein C0167_00820 [Nitrososphaera sp.]|jgi:hypothetical protein|nr:MAG: hypothetical protein C0167_00820 [Nitrososphaera sp.]
MSERTIDGVHVFVAKVSASRTKVNGRTYEAYRLTVPRDAADRMEVKEDDYLVVMAKKARWYHLIKWDEDSLNDAELSDDIKREVRYLRVIDETGKVLVPVPTQGMVVGIKLGSAVAGFNSTGSAVAGFNSTTLNGEGI